MIRELIDVFKHTQKIHINNYLKILLFIMPQLLNIFTLLIMFLVIFIILGINLFSTVKYGEIINDNVNFKNGFSSLNTLLRVLTGDQWNEVMIAYAIKSKNCTNDYQSYNDLIKMKRRYNNTGL